ncbi:MAG: sporulation protein YqfD [Clostridiales bacterium]|nr:sporulation protein YqfD [Clostridiales bacterium]
MHYITVLVEGFDPQKLLSLCLKEGIALWNIHIRSDLEMTLKLEAKDWKKFMRLKGNRYRVTILSEKGIKPLLKRAFSNKTALIGVALFIFLIYFQSLFISEIRIYGYKSYTEREIREKLKYAGLYEGCSKSIDLDKVEIDMYKQFEDLSWIGIELKGNLAEVTIVEGTKPIPIVDKEQPCHIVAAKEGYIEKTIAREGKGVVEKGDFVREGDLLITGMIPIEDKTYTQDPENPGYRYVHADGEVYAKTIYRFVYYQEKEELHKDLTGREMPGFSIRIGDLTFNSADIFRPFNSAIYEETVLINTVRPFPIEFATNKQKEVKLRKQTRDHKDIEKRAKQQLREAIKEYIPESAQILNNSLKFSEEENIIEVVIMVEALEDIGKKIIFKPAIESEEGNSELGESTE